jgi:AraC family ethanolamine operon transcriptional activator
MPGEPSVSIMTCPTSVGWNRILDSGDLDLHVSAQDDWSLQYVQLSGGAFRGRMHRVRLPQMVVVREDIAVAMRQRGSLDPASYGFALSLEPRDDLFFAGRRAGPHAVMCGRGHELDLTTPGDARLIAVVVDRALLTDAWERIHRAPLAPWLENQMVLETDAEKADRVRATHLRVLGLATDAGDTAPHEAVRRQWRDELLLDWIDALPPHADVAGLDTLARRKRVVDRACALMLAHADMPLSILDLCREVGASRRKLNYCFQDVLGTTPVRYLRAARLNGVRRALRAAGPGATVQDVAAQWGFWHMSQFAQDYRRLFGELPSATLRAAVPRPETPPPQSPPATTRGPAR